MNLNTLDQRFADLAKLNTDTYCHDLAYTAFALTCTELSKRGKAQVVALADRIIAEREREASALRTNEAREQMVQGPASYPPPLTEYEFRRECLRFLGQHRAEDCANWTVGYLCTTLRHLGPRGVALANRMPAGADRNRDNSAGGAL